MGEMRNDGGGGGGRKLSAVEATEESGTQHFTAVNNSNGNSNHRSQLPPLSSGQTPGDMNPNPGSATSTIESPRYSLKGDQHWQHNRPPGMDMNGVPQKRKRSPEIENQRAVTPTTQTTHHHLAAHEAALGAEEQGGMNNHQHKRQHAEVNEKHGGNYAVDDEKLNDVDGTRAGALEGSPQPGSQQGQGKRKRVFSNRTKTGCITCRRRKKKCDEGKPECSNCKRGGFVCEGYSGKINWQKPPGRSTTTVGAPVSIQSKTEQAGSTSASPSPVVVVQKQSQTHRLDEAVQHQSPQTRMVQYPYVTPTVVPEKQISEESTSPNTVELPTPHPPPRVQIPQPPALPAFVSVVPQQVTPTNNAAASHRASVSQAAITAASGSSVPRERSEKEKMIGSELYFAGSPELVQERERCKAACWRFNNAATNPDLGISKAEKGRLLHQILRPERTWEAMRANGLAEVSYISDAGTPSDIVDVHVDAPFNCSYGYNIRLGKDVLIEAGCKILDSCFVTIKARTILSPDVSIYSATHPIDPRKRNGSKGPELAKPVTIEEDCWLGGNVIVLGGISIGKGSVVGAGSVVTRDVPPYTVVAGNPARVIRGIYRNDSTDM